MSLRQQFNRIYLLNIGGIDVNVDSLLPVKFKKIETISLEIKPPLNISFNIVKKRDKSKLSGLSEITVYNLSDEVLNQLENSEKKLNVSLYVGYSPLTNTQNNNDETFGCILRGNVLNISTKMEGEDRVTLFYVSEAYSSLNDVVSTRTIAQGKTIGDVITSLIDDINTYNKQNNIALITKTDFNGENHKSKLDYGYPLRGTPFDILSSIATAYSLEWNIENNNFYLDDYYGNKRTSTVNTYIYSKDTGLIELPFFESKNVTVKLDEPVTITDKNGKAKVKNFDKKRVFFVKFTALLNPLLKTGDLVQFALQRLNSQFNNKYFIVDEIRYRGEFRGNKWEIECIANEVEVIK